MSKSVPFVASLAGVLTVLTYYAVPLLVASETVRKYAPQVEASMERMVRGLQGKTLFCTEDEVAPKPELITPSQVLSLVSDVSWEVMDANRYEYGLASRFVNTDCDSTAAMGYLYAIGHSFLRNANNWTTFCSKKSTSLNVQHQLSQDLHEMDDCLREYRSTIEKHARGAVRIRVFVMTLIGLDLSAAAWVILTIRRRMRRSAIDSSKNTY